MGFVVIVWEAMHWSNLAQGQDQRAVVANTVMKMWIP